MSSVVFDRPCMRNNVYGLSYMARRHIFQAALAVSILLKCLCIGLQNTWAKGTDWTSNIWLLFSGDIVFCGIITTGFFSNLGKKAFSLNDTWISRQNLKHSMIY